MEQFLPHGYMVANSHYHVKLKSGFMPLLTMGFSPARYLAPTAESWVRHTAARANAMGWPRSHKSARQLTAYCRGSIRIVTEISR